MKQIQIAAFLLLTLASCRKYPDTSTLINNTTVITNHDATVSFGTYKTYYMSDKIALIADNPKDTVLSASYGDPILKAIADNMASRGFTRVLTYTNADLGINSVAIKITTTVTTYPPSYWWGYPGYGGCYYGGCGYYPYYPFSYSYDYSTGSVMTHMADLKNIKGNKLNMVWTNFNSAVLGSGTTANVTKAVSGVNQAFRQSEYLKTN